MTDNQQDSESNARVPHIKEEWSREKAFQATSINESLSPAEMQRALHELRVHQIELELQNEELRRLQEELEDGRERYFELYNLAPVGYCTLSQEGIVREANLTLSSRLGQPHSALLKQPLSQFIAREDQDRYYLFRRRLSKLAVAQSQSCELRMLKKDGTPLWVRLEATLAMNPREQGLIWLVISDMTESKLVEIKEREIETLKLTNRIKGELLANVSHELRTPLASIKGFIETLIETDVKWSPQQQLEFLQSANKETDRLIALIKDFLDMARIDSNKMVLNKQACSLGSVIEQIAGELAIVTDRHKLKVASLAGIPPVEMDKGRVGEVIRNLVENAAKFSPEGSRIIVKASFSNRNLIISVQDFGIGISPETLPKIFDRFYQAQQGASAKPRGTGLGLSICKGIVEAHGGEIGVTSQPAKGSTFRFSIPRNKGNELT